MSRAKLWKNCGKLKKEMNSVTERLSLLISNQNMINKQAIKQFLKPNKKKILVFVIFGIILLFIPIIPCSIYHGGGSLPPSERWSENLLCSPLMCVIDSNIVLPRKGGNVADCPWSLIALIYFLSYILSCFVVFIYNKLKIRKQ